MADFGVIAAVSETLRVALTDALSSLSPAPIAVIHDLQGNISTNPARLTIFLFDVAEDPSARNRPSSRVTSPPDVIVQRAPMALLLRYLLTPWSGDPLTDHMILGRAMQTLYDQAILSGSALQGSLTGTADSLKITLAPLNLEERTRVWHSVHKPYRISASYEIRVVNLDSERGRQVRPVSSRNFDDAAKVDVP